MKPSLQWVTPSRKRHTPRWFEAITAACPKPRVKLTLSSNSRTPSCAVVKSQRLSLVVTVTGEVPCCRHWAEQMRIRSTSSQTTIYRFKQTPAESPAPEREVISVCFHSVATVPSCSFFLLKTYLFVKCVPPPRSHGLLPPSLAPPPSALPLPHLELTWLILFPRTGSSSCLQLWGRPPLPPTHPPSQPGLPTPTTGNSPHLPPPPSNTSKLLCNAPCKFHMRSYCVAFPSPPPRRVVLWPPLLPAASPSTTLKQRSDAPEWPCLPNLQRGWKCFYKGSRSTAPPDVRVLKPNRRIGCFDWCFDTWLLAEASLLAAMCASM